MNPAFVQVASAVASHACAAGSNAARERSKMKSEVAKTP